MRKKLTLKAIKEWLPRQQSIWPATYNSVLFNIKVEGRAFNELSKLICDEPKKAAIEHRLFTDCDAVVPPVVYDQFKSLDLSGNERQVVCDIKVMLDRGVVDGRL